ncbi:hypothetical protein D3C80_869400 [compost metagenome]
MNHLAQVDLDLTAVAILCNQAVTTEVLVQATKTLFDGLVAVVQLGAFGIHVCLGSRIELTGKFQLTGLQAQTLKAVVDGADVLLLKLLQLASQLVSTFEARLQLGPRSLALSDNLAVFLDADQVAVEVTPLTTLQCNQVDRLLLIDQPFANHPSEVAAIEVTVADLDQLTGHELRTLVRHRQAGTFETRAWHFFLLHHFADDDMIRLARYVVAGLNQVSRPEVAQTAYGDHREQTNGHDHSDGDGATADPDARGAALEPAFEGILFHGSLPFYQSDEYFLRRRWRISSAKVFITKVNISSTSAARNSTR